MNTNENITFDVEGALGDLASYRESDNLSMLTAAAIGDQVAEFVAIHTPGHEAAGTALILGSAAVQEITPEGSQQERLVAGMCNVLAFAGERLIVDARASAPTAAQPHTDCGGLHGITSRDGTVRRIRADEEPVPGDVLPHGIVDSDGHLQPHPKTSDSRESDTVQTFIVERENYITAIKNCPAENTDDYWRWQGHAEARRQLSEQLTNIHTRAEAATGRTAPRAPETALAELLRAADTAHYGGPQHSLDGLPLDYDHLAAAVVAEGWQPTVFDADGHAVDCQGCDGPGIVPCAADRVIGDFAYRDGQPIKNLKAGAQ